MKRLHVSIDPEMLARLKAVAGDSNDCSVASIVRYCVDQELPKLEKMWTPKAKP
jgi:hypothetical protein